MSAPALTLFDEKTYASLKLKNTSLNAEPSLIFFTLPLKNSPSISSKQYMVIINQALGQKGSQLLSYITPENVLFHQTMC